jgi:undecaprenyl-diphosphatase
LPDDTLSRVVAVVLNPLAAQRSGQDDLKSRLEAVAASRAATVHWYLTSPEDAGEVAARQALRDGARLVIACGGDGTIMACASSLFDAPAALGIVPAGTGNLIAVSLGIPDGPGRAMDAALTGVPTEVRLGLLGDRAFFAASIGLGAEVMRRTRTSSKTRWGTLAYLASAVQLVSYPVDRVRLVLDGSEPVDRVAQAVLVGHLRQLQVRRLPPADADGLDVAVVGLPGWSRMTRSRRRSRGRIRPAAVEWFRASTVTVTLNRCHAFEGDGEFLGESDRLVARAHDSQVTVVLPRQTTAGRPLCRLLRRILRDLRTGVRDVIRRGVMPARWRCSRTSWCAAGRDTHPVEVAAQAP